MERKMHLDPVLFLRRMYRCDGRNYCDYYHHYHDAFLDYGKQQALYKQNDWGHVHNSGGGAGGVS